MSDKLIFLKNVLGQVEELNEKQNQLQQAKDQINLSGNVELRGELSIAGLHILLNDLSKDVPPAISSNLRMVLSQYVDYLIQKNGQLQRDLLSNIQIAHMQQQSTSETNESFSSFADEKKSDSQPLVSTPKPQKVEIPPIFLKEMKKKEETRLEELEPAKQELIVPTVAKVEEVPIIEEDIQKKEIIEAQKERSLSSHSEILNRLDIATYKERLRKIIAEQFYNYKKGDFIHPKDIQAKILEKTGDSIELVEINNVAWVLISQDVLEFIYLARCKNGHEAYLFPPVSRKNSCKVCKDNVMDVDISYKKLV